eukprot:scaffold95477_cov34-Tisochrysis_lutea.AAC.4
MSSPSSTARIGLRARVEPSVQGRANVKVDENSAAGRALVGVGWPMHAAIASDLDVRADDSQLHHDIDDIVQPPRIVHTHKLSQIIA